MKILRLAEDKISELSSVHPLIGYLFSFILLPLTVITAVSVFTAVFAVPAAYLFGLV